MKKRSARVSCSGLLLAVVGFIFLLYWSWSWGVWGQKNLFLQNLFQCYSPPGSEEARYPTEVDVLAPACQGPYGVEISPSGQYMYVKGGTSPLYDFKTDSLVPVNLSSFGHAYFLTDEMLFVSNCDMGKCDDRLYTIANAQLFQLSYFLPDPNKPIAPATLSKLQEAQNVYVILFGINAKIIALASNSLHHPDDNISYGYMPADEMFQLLKEHNIQYETVGASSISHNGLYEWRGDGIYRRADGVRVVVNYEFSDPSKTTYYGKGWIYGDEGVVLQTGTNAVYAVGRPPWFALFPVSSPILLLKAPKESLTPEARVKVEVREQRELINRVGAAILGVAVEFAVAAGVWWLWRRERWFGGRQDGSNGQQTD